ncbi:sugar phosphate isomerase/epimerase [uncultured Sphaerochaeta sp.]|uniref:sugar phosphate isomerase/epimerase family protein n=1 Tax=uncultured Sphaerochaeta sp. TaxID=886478 RepID=UPI002A0A8BF2|nr:sugar phosphate isomerase/epimerase [uncultured Sphaerochaeta sp.]
MRYGVFSVSMPEYGIDETIEILAKLGYEGVEWRVKEIPTDIPSEIPYENRYWIDNKSTLDIDNLEVLAPQVAQKCKAAGLAIFGLATYLMPKDVERIIPVLEAAKRIGCPMVRVFPYAYDGKQDYSQIFDKAKQEVKSLEALARNYSVKIVMEIHMDTIIASPSSAYRLLKDCDPRYIGLIFDPGNLVYEGYENYLKSFQLLKAYIAHVHVKNGCLVEEGKDSFGARKFKRLWTPLKDGMANLSELFSVMKIMGYDQTISIEDFSNEEETIEKLASNLEYLKLLEKEILYK